eukprot:4388616-Pyramimonas_sp.AAC.1
MDAPDVSGSISVINSPVTPLQPELIKRRSRLHEDDSNHTNSFAMDPCESIPVINSPAASLHL